MHCALDVHRGAKNQFRNFKLTKKEVTRESISKMIKNQSSGWGAKNLSETSN